MTCAVLVLVVTVVVGLLTADMFVAVALALVEWMLRSVGALWPTPVLLVLPVAAISMLVTRTAVVCAVTAEFIRRAYTRAEEKIVGGFVVVFPPFTIVSLLQGLCLEF